MYCVGWAREKKGSEPNNSLFGRPWLPVNVITLRDVITAPWHNRHSVTLHNIYSPQTYPTCSGQISKDTLWCQPSKHETLANASSMLGQRRRRRRRWASMEQALTQRLVFAGIATDAWFLKISLYFAQENDRWSDFYLLHRDTWLYILF